MTQKELEDSEQRGRKFRALEKERVDLWAALEILNGGGTGGKSPFTGNTRESRLVKSIHIKFSKTLGGAAEVETEISDLNIAAWDFAEVLKLTVKTRLAVIKTQIEEL